MNVRTGSAFFRFAIFLACSLILGAPLVAQTEELDVLTDWFEWGDAPRFLRQSLNAEAQKMLAGRQASVSLLRTRADWEKRQGEVRATLTRLMAPFPARSPLNAKVTGKIEKDWYRVEKVVFESLPGFRVTGGLFVPAGLQGKAPAILNVIGHTDIGFRSNSYQQLILNLVRKGFIVFAIDPIGQGERLQYFDPELGRSLVGGATAEHSYLGIQGFFSGRPAAHYFTWDGIRAIDYLVSRPEVDAARIGVTGISGGGTQTSYISAMDDRVKAAAPANYICGFARLFESIGPQDAEQNLPGGVAAGIDHGDFLEIRAPKPTMVVATTRDFFSIQGARETVAEASAAFKALGAPENLSMVEDDHGHGYTRRTREAIYAFFQKYLENPGSPVDEVLEALAPRDLQVTATGQLIGSLGGETVHTLNRILVGELKASLEKSRSDLRRHLAAVPDKARRITGYREPPEIREVVFRGRYPRPGYAIEKYGLAGSNESLLPFLLLIPDGGGRHPAVVYLHPAGKKTAAASGGPAEMLAKKGFAVLIPDLSGVGELGSGDEPEEFEVDEPEAFLALQVGRSVTAVRAAEIVNCLRYLKRRSDVASDAVSLVARGEMTVAALHAAAFEKGFKKVALVDPPVSLAETASHKFYNASPAVLIGGLLGHYDLPDLAALLAPGDLLMLTPRDHLAKPATPEAYNRELAVVRDAYGSNGRFTARSLAGFAVPEEEIGNWLK